MGYSSIPFQKIFPPILRSTSADVLYLAKLSVSPLFDVFRPLEKTDELGSASSEGLVNRGWGPPLCLLGEPTYQNLRLPASPFHRKSFSTLPLSPNTAKRLTMPFPPFTIFAICTHVQPKPVSSKKAEEPPLRSHQIRLYSQHQRTIIPTGYPSPP